MRPTRPAAGRPSDPTPGLTLRAAALLIAAAFGLTPGASLHAEPPADPPAPAESASRATPRVLPFIDELIAQSWKEAKVSPSRVATDEEFLRRVYLDTLGRTPTIAEARGFLGVKDTGKRQKLVDTLLESPDFAKNLANQWTVLLIGRKDQGRRVVRESLNLWLRRQFLDGRPWDRTVSDLVTATGSNKENGATNFTLAHMEGGAVPLTSMTTRVFLGQQVQCAQCHDHPTTGWKQSDFWGMNAFYQGLKAETVRKDDGTGVEVEDHTDLSDKPTDKYAKFDKRNGLVGIAFPEYLDGRKIARTRRSTAAPNSARCSPTRRTTNFRGRSSTASGATSSAAGMVHPVDDFGPHNPPSHPELLEKLATAFRESHYDVKALVGWITATRAYNLTSSATRRTTRTSPCSAT